MRRRKLVFSIVSWVITMGLGWAILHVHKLYGKRGFYVYLAGGLAMYSGEEVVYNRQER